MIMERLLQTASVIALALFVHGSANAQVAACRGGQKPTQIAEMMFGRKVGDRISVSEVEWSRFVDREITPRFPAGLTVYNAAGQWQDTTTKKVVHEPSKIVHIVLPGDDDEIERLNAIAEAYKSRFKQQSVAVIVRAACVSF
jgi:uncharacterized protein DUF3574